MELNKEQQEIVKTKDSKVIVLSCAASGKTAVLTERVKYLLDCGIDEKGIVVITFTNAAAEEMKKRIGNRPNLFIGTIHSYANYLLRASGIDTKKLIDDEDFDGLFNLVKENEECIKPVKFLLLDEAQDSTLEQFDFIFDMIKPDNYFVVGDHRQSIYSFSGGRPDILVHLSKQEDVTTYELDKNYRNGYNILETAKFFLEPLGEDFYDESIPMSINNGKALYMEYDIDRICNIIKTKDTYKDWFFLTRTNALADEVIFLLKKRGIPCDSFKKAELSSDQLLKKMEENTVKVLTIHTSKGLEVKNVVVAGARPINEEERRVCYVAATRAKELLIWTKNKRKKNHERTVSWE